jgi:hypothetical protein
LTRRAAFLVVMDGDPTKPEIAFGQQYFAVSTRTLEVVQKRLAEAARLQAREKLTETESRFQGVLYERRPGTYPLRNPEVTSRPSTCLKSEVPRSTKSWASLS